MEQAMAAKRLRMLDKVKRDNMEVQNAARRRGRETYAAAYRALQQKVSALAEHHGTEVKRRRAAEAECVTLRQRLAALEPASEPRPGL
jgi:hypothetical protein